MDSKRINIFLASFFCLAVLGCIEKPQQTGDYTPFETTELEAVLSIVVDLSGSFQDDWQKDGRAHKLFLDLINQFFTEGMGEEARVVIGQISNSDSFVLFDGTPQELSRRFRSPEALNKFLQENADPQGSKVYRSTKRMLDYVSELNGVTETTKLLVVVLSDLKDSETSASHLDEADNDVFASLQTYSKTGGGVALYFVADDEKIRWRKLLQQAKFPPSSFVVEGQLTESPQLPSFE